MGIDLSGWNQFAQNLGNLRQQWAPLPQPDNLGGLTGGAPSGGFLSSLFGGGQDTTGLNSQVAQQQSQMLPQQLPAQQQGFMGNVLNGGQIVVPNPAAAPQVAQAEIAHRTGWPSIPDAQAFGEQVGAQLGMAPGTATAMIGKEYGGPGNPVGDSGSSFGPLQLHYGGMNPSMPHPGMGNDFDAKTGLSAKDPSTWQQQIVFGLQNAAKGGWGAWATSRDKLGWGNFTGIGGNPTQLASAQPRSGALVQAAASVPTGADYVNTPPTPADWAGTRDQFIQQYKQSHGTQLAGPVPTPNAAPVAQAAVQGNPAITVPGYEELGPVTIDKATDAEGFPSKQEWMAAQAKGVPAVNMGAGAAAPTQQMAQARPQAVPAPAQAGPAPQNAAPGAAAPYAQNAPGQAAPSANSLPTPPAGPALPHYSDQALQQMAANPYQHWKLQQIQQQQQQAAQLQNQMAMAYYQKQLEEGTAKIQEFPVNDANGNMVGKQHAFVGLGTNGQPQIVPFGAVDTNVIKATASKLPTSVQEWQFAKDHPDYARASKWVPNATTDALGQPQGGWVSPPNPAQAGQGGPVGAQGAGGQNTAIVGGKQIDMSQPDWFDQLPLTYQQAIKNYVGGQTMPTGRGGFVQEIKLLAQKYGNDIGLPADDTTFNARKAMRNSLSVTTPNSLGGQMQFLNTGIGHLATMSDNAIALNNSDGWGSTTLAHAINNIRGLTTDQAAAVGKIQDSAVRYGQELTKFYAGSPGGEQERQAFLANVEGAKSPKELASVIENEAELIPSRGLGLQGQIDQGLGPLAAQYQVFRPESKTALEKISNNVSTLRGQNQGAGGLFPSIAAVPGPAQSAAPAPAPAQQTMQRAPIPPGETPATLVLKGRQAIQAGAPAAAVGQRLQGYGIDPRNLVPQQ
jgi:hypothetical protein